MLLTLLSAQPPAPSLALRRASPVMELHQGEVYFGSQNRYIPGVGSWGNDRMGFNSLSRDYPMGTSRYSGNVMPVGAYGGNFPSTTYGNRGGMWNSGTFGNQLHSGMNYGYGMNNYGMNNYGMNNYGMNNYGRGMVSASYGGSFGSSLNNYYGDRYHGNTYGMNNYGNNYGMNNYGRGMNYGNYGMHGYGSMSGPYRSSGMNSWY